jgi:hypothetical protein
MAAQDQPGLLLQNQLMQAAAPCVKPSQDLI